MAVRSLLVALLLALAAAAPTGAAEYRLQVASLYERSFLTFVPASAPADPVAEGLERLAVSLDRGDLSRGLLLLDRRPRPAPADTARAFGAAPVPAVAGVPSATGGALWDEVRWQGEPGQRSLWLVRPASRNAQEAIQIALGGGGPLSLHAPAAPGSAPAPVLVLPEATVSAGVTGQTLWSGHLARALDLSRGIAVVVARSELRAFPDTVYAVVAHAPGPATYRVAIGWRQHLSPERSAPARRR